MLNFHNIKNNLFIDEVVSSKIPENSSYGRLRNPGVSLTIALFSIQWERARSLFVSTFIMVGF